MKVILCIFYFAQSNRRRHAPSAKPDKSRSPNFSTMASTIDSPAGSYFRTNPSSVMRSPVVYNSAIDLSFDEESDLFSPNLAFQLQREVRQVHHLLTLTTT